MSIGKLVTKGSNIKSLSLFKDNDPLFLHIISSEQVGKKSSYSCAPPPIYL